MTAGDVEISEIAALLADRARCRVLLALNDGRALAASVLADEAGVSRATASSHLAKLTDAAFDYKRSPEDPRVIWYPG